MSVGLVTGLAVMLPLAGALLILLVGRWPNVREGVSLVTAGALLTLVLRLVDPVKAGLRPHLVLVEVDVFPPQQPNLGTAGGGAVQHAQKRLGLVRAGKIAAEKWDRRRR